VAVSRSEAATQSKDPYLAQHSRFRKAFRPPPSALQLPPSRFMFPMDHRTLRALISSTPKRSAQRHSNRDANAQPHRNVPGHYSGNRAQRRAQRNTQSRMFRLVHSQLQVPTARVWGQPPRLSRRAQRGGSTSPHPPPEASPPYPQSAAPCRATLQAACPKASRTAPAPVPPSSRCRR